MRISACYIVKNEEENLPHSLASLLSNADEIIVVDTGSCDATMEIAQEYGAKVYSQPWQDNFALHRNYALSKTTGDWVIFLDADEYFVNSSGLSAYLKKADKYQEVEGLLLPLININPDTGKDMAELMDRAYSLRIWRNNEHFRFVGCVHEMLYAHEKWGLRPIKMIKAHEKFTLHHTGYRKRILRQKLERYLHMLQKEIKEYGEQPLSARYLADCYFGLEKYDEAAYYAQRAIIREKAMGVSTVAGFYKLYRYWLEAGKHLHYPPEEMQRIARMAVADTANEENYMEMRAFAAQWE